MVNGTCGHSEDSLVFDVAKRGLENLFTGKGEIILWARLLHSLPFSCFIFIFGTMSNEYQAGWPLTS